MAFQFTDDLTAHYYTHGYAVFRQILPPKLVDDLRVQADRAKELARTKHGAQVQRVMQIWDLEEIDLQPFVAFSELPVLSDALARLLSPRHIQGIPGAILCEPAARPYTIPWHRDWRDNAGVGDDDFRDVRFELDILNQVNAPLYADDSLWVVPGSHFRDDLPSERVVADEGVGGMKGVYGTEEARSFGSLTGDYDSLDDDEKLSVFRAVDEMSDAEREYRGLQYCAGMPGAACLALGVGDVAIYRDSLWHTGTYVSYKKRATIHGAIDTPAYAEWRARMRGAEVEFKAYEKILAERGAALPG